VFPCGKTIETGQAMLILLQVVTLMLVALAAALSVAHALELPGKLRLDEATYRAVQRIYYPGFTIGGASEPLASIAALALLILTPVASVAFWLTLVALVGMALVQLVFWIVVQPVNRHWVAGQAMSASGAAFFRVGTGASGNPGNWTRLRDRWEYAHVARAAINSASLLALAVAIAL
jgi:hypothetical protein